MYSNIKNNSSDVSDQNYLSQLEGDTVTQQQQQLDNNCDISGLQLLLHLQITVFINWCIELVKSSMFVINK
jgi:hypothetical protein